MEKDETICANNPKGHTFIIFNSGSWRNPKDTDTCWGQKCKHCSKVISVGFTKKHLKNEKD